ncbi:MAG: hypothetical protein A3E82_03165 [Gammaproteobacteria bacterium RIFCSPHIGHO2_12_FULL_38_11]|nr:MAG: hypothetical protein A3E82_03165 [Gammaproteobacteria bacterium RIFCSPHIGHO2_12_FULL_38_11]
MRIAKIFFHYVINALHRPKRIFQVIKNAFVDLKFGGKYLGISLQNFNEENGYINTGSSEYDCLDILFSKVDITERDIIIDLGCGKGRVINWFLNKNIKNKILGIEVYPEIADFTRNRLKKYKQVEILTGCVGENINLIKQGTIFYLYHPFRERLMKNFSDQVLALINSKVYHDKLRPLIVYHNSCYLHIFEKDPRWKTQKLGRIGEHESAIIYPTYGA